MSGGETTEYPARAGHWPAVVGFAIVIWLELVARVDGGRTLGLLLVAYTLVTVAGMSYFGREKWRSQAEIFSVWFRLLGRLAPFALEGEPEDGKVRRRPFASGLLSRRLDGRRTWSWSPSASARSSSTACRRRSSTSTCSATSDLLGLPVVARHDRSPLSFIGRLVAIVLGVARRLNVAALGAGLLPVAVGYLIAHYLTFLLVDGQRILAAINDPLLRGDNLLPFDLGVLGADALPADGGAVEHPARPRSWAATSSARGPATRLWREDGEPVAASRVSCLSRR